jgi:hypothetical protein
VTEPPNDGDATVAPANRSAPFEESVTAGRLRYDHRSFATRFLDIRTRSGQEGWLNLSATWTALGADIVRHLAFEELAVFPAFARHKPGEALLIARLIDEHEDLRSFVDRIASAILTSRVDTRTLDGFAVLMSNHADIENKRLDPWLELQDRRHDPGGRTAR